MQAKIAAYQPVVDAIERYMTEHNLPSLARISEKLYGRDSHGKIITSAYATIRGEVAPSPPMRARFKERLGLDLPIVEGPPRKPYRWRQLTVTPAKAAVIAYEKAVEASEPSTIKLTSQPIARAKAPPRFALTIDQDGRSSVSLNLVDVSADDALRCLSALAAADLLKPGEH